MAIGLTFVFYVIHMRVWVVPIRDASGGLALWVGGSANRNRDAFEHTFNKVLELIRKELKQETVVAAEKRATSIAGR
jgi:cytochrome c biogenesis protein ResB